MTVGVLGDPDELARRLAMWVGAKLEGDGAAGGERCTCVLLDPPPSGNSNFTLPFLARWVDGAGGSAEEQLVLRLQHDENQIFLDADVVREHRVLAALAREGSVPVPRPRWVETDPSVLGHPFFVMDRVPGIVPAGIPSIHQTGWLAERSEPQRRRAWDSALDAMVAVHQVDWRTHLPFLADAANGSTVEQRLAHLSAWYAWATQGRPFPITDAALTYLRVEATRLDPGPPVLVWGDARMGNLLFGAEGEVSAILDWELASIGPAGIDLGWWLMFEVFSTDAHGIASLPGYPDRAATIAAYEERAGRVVADVRWYEILAAWMVSVTVIRMADTAVAAGRLSPDTRMGEGNLTAQMLARWLDLPVPDLDPDYATRRGLTATPGGATA